VFILFLIRGWSGLQVSVKNGEDDLFFSIIIPVRNEVKYISELMYCLENQTYPFRNFEVIVIDDSSDDGTYEELHKISRRSDLNIKVLHLPVSDNSHFSHKKAAITLGIEKSAGEIILMTDGDVQMGKYWIQIYADFFSGSGSKMISGPVMMTSSTFLEEMQSIEFASLIGTGAAMLFFNKPTMCNGANLAFRKDVFNEVNGYEDNKNIASGDDEFLMYKINKRYPLEVTFLKSVHSTVWIKPASSFKDFYNQRRRWSGKWREHANSHSKILAIYIFIVHFSLLILVVSGLLKLIPVHTVIFIWIIKFIIEYVFFNHIYHFFARPLKIFPFVISSLLYSIYAVTFGILSNFGGFEWKGRQYKH
jgi:cellulose synthase/poly-beta-1,6-N-acetylglucosamine synthase-like glycosyltransferase